MTRSRPLSLLLLFLAIQSFILAGCQHATFFQKPSTKKSEEEIDLKKTEDQVSTLRAQWTEAANRKLKNTTVIIVPRAGHQTLEGTQIGDGARTYLKPIALGAILQEHFANSSYSVLAYDKRPNTTGTVELAKDLDLACALVRSKYGQKQKIILFGSDQATQVILNSNCKNSASAIALASPIPDALDNLWVSALKEAGLLDRAESLSATFEAINQELFEPDAKVMGASLTFWKNWIKQSRNSFAQLDALNVPILYLVGEKDVFVGRYGRDVIGRLIKNKASRKLLVIPLADRNLLQNEALSQRTFETMISALGLLVK